MKKRPRSLSIEKPYIRRKRAEDELVSIQGIHVTRGRERGTTGYRKWQKPNSHAFEGIQLRLGYLIEPIILKRADERVLGDAFM